jgi:DNA-directed RNA polymerase omega subunit
MNTTFMEQSNVSLDKVDNRFLFVLLSARRALQLQKGARPRVETITKKPTVVAMTEVLQNRVEYHLPGSVKPKGKGSSK